MIIETERFGHIPYSDAHVFTFPAGLIGFPEATRMVVVERGTKVVWLQSTTDPALAFPAVDAMHVGNDYPNRPHHELAREAALPGARFLVLVIAHVRAGRLCVNLLAPVILDVDGMLGAQVVLDPQLFSTSVAIEREGAAKGDQRTESRGGGSVRGSTTSGAGLGSGSLLAISTSTRSSASTSGGIADDSARG